MINKRIKHNVILFSILTFLQSPCVIMCCNILSHKGLANVNTEKNVLSSLLYTFLSSKLGLKPSTAVY